MSETLAIISRVGYGLRDRSIPMLWFDTNMSEGSGALQVFFQPEADEVIKDHGVRDVQDLEGKPCWVEVDGRLVKYLRAAKMGRR
jgi:hypothetical protein